jgi:transposase InsO family protein
MGKRPSAVATLVERRTRYLRIVPLPDGYKADAVQHALLPTLPSCRDIARRINTRPRRVLDWATSAELFWPHVHAGVRPVSRSPTGIHSIHGSQFTSWAFTQRAKDSGLLPSMGTIGDAYDNAVIEAFWARMQTGLLDRRRWRTRVELDNAIFEYLEIFHNRQRRHSALGWRTLVVFERLHHRRRLTRTRQGPPTGPHQACSRHAGQPVAVAGLRPRSTRAALPVDAVSRPAKMSVRARW